MEPICGAAHIHSSVQLEMKTVTMLLTCLDGFQQLKGFFPLVVLLTASTPEEFEANHLPIRLIGLPKRQFVLCL